jgi:hypothetical protein
MKTVTACLLGAVLLALVAAICLMVGLLDRDLARAEEHLIASEYEPLEPILQRAVRYYQYASLVPWIADGPLHDIRARQAALQYWQRRYAGLVPDQADPLASVPPDNVALQFLVANAVYRADLATATDKATMLAALDGAASAYQTVLKNAEQHHDAAYNYEYVVRLRNDIDRGRRKTPAPVPVRGREGLSGMQPEESVDDAKFKVYVPLEQEQIDKNVPGDAGKQAPIRKKG